VHPIDAKLKLVTESHVVQFGLDLDLTVRQNLRYFALLRVEAINGDDPNLLSRKIFFDDLKPVHPDGRIVLERAYGKAKMEEYLSRSIHHVLVYPYLSVQSPLQKVIRMLFTSAWANTPCEV